MISATIDLDFSLPDAKPIDRPLAFTAAQMHGLSAIGKSQAHDHSAALQRIIDRAEELRGGAVTWVTGLPLGDLVTWTVRNARGSAPLLRAPVTFFKPERMMWIPKVVIRVCPEYEIRPDEIAACHATCRRGSIEFLCITQAHIEAGYLDRKDFKRAFNGAFFCDPRHNSTIFCPTLRDWGFHTWPEIPSPLKTSTQNAAANNHRCESGTAAWHAP